MNSKITVTVIAFFILYLSPTQCTLTIRSRVEPRCQCINYVSEPINPCRMKDIEILPISPHCSQVEVIITLKDGTKVCVDPEASWVKPMIDRLLVQN
ncbi:interleukin-8-like [Scyliorhinus torazame]|uniref:interleukin-8-like n=1 Tax=Scyliorhinus torazame TaxID=75743 RepID=UPI003B5B4C4C